MSQRNRLRAHLDMIHRGPNPPTGLKTRMSFAASHTVRPNTSGQRAWALCRHGRQYRLLRVSVLDDGEPVTDQDAESVYRPIRARIWVRRPGAPSDDDISNWTVWIHEAQLDDWLSAYEIAEWLPGAYSRTGRKARSSRAECAR